MGLIEAPDGSGTGNNIVFPPRHGCRNEPGTVFLDANPSAPATERWKWLNQFDGPGGFGKAPGFCWYVSGLHSSQDASNIVVDRSLRTGQP